MLERTPRGEPEEPPRRRLQVVRWGLVPSWAKDPSIGNRMINARMETRRREAGVPAGVREAALRCCRPTATSSGTARCKGKKQPFFIRPADGGVLAMAGLYELWRDPSVPEDADVDAVAVDRDRADHDRDRRPRPHPRPDAAARRTRPVRRVARPGRRGDRPAARPAGAGSARACSTAYPVSKTVSNVKNNGPELVEPLPAEGADLAEAVEDDCG